MIWAYMCRLLRKTDSLGRSVRDALIRLRTRTLGGRLPTPIAAANGSHAAAVKASWQAWPLDGGVAVECREKGRGWLAGSRFLQRAIVPLAVHSHRGDRGPSIRRPGRGACGGIATGRWRRAPICRLLRSPDHLRRRRLPIVRGRREPLACDFIAVSLKGLRSPLGRAMRMGFLLTMAGAAMGLIPPYTRQSLWSTMFCGPIRTGIRSISRWPSGFGGICESRACWRGSWSGRELTYWPG